MTGPMRILLFGAHGQVGRELARALAPSNAVVPLTRQQLDLTSEVAIASALKQWRPAVVINAAAYTAVDRAEEEPDLAMLINGKAPGTIGRAAREMGAVVVHFSSDYVFDGTVRRPRREDELAAPINVYGRTKLAGEGALAASGASHLIIRTSWVYGMHGHNFVRTMLRLAHERDLIRVVDDQHGAPTWARWLAESVAVIIQQLRGHEGGLQAGFGAHGGLLHLSGGGVTTWHALAEAVIALDPAREAQIVRRLEPVSTADYGALAPRPAYSVLDNALAATRFGIRSPAWHDQLRIALTT